jgi:hypothetical protein
MGVELFEFIPAAQSCGVGQTRGQCNKLLTSLTYKRTKIRYHGSPQCIEACMQWPVHLTFL